MQLHVGGVVPVSLLGGFGDDDQPLAEFVRTERWPAGNQRELFVRCWFEELQVGNLFRRSRSFSGDEFLCGHRVRIFDVTFVERDVCPWQKFVQVRKKLPVPRHMRAKDDVGAVAGEA